MLVAGDDDLIGGHVEIHHGRACTEEHDGVQGHLKLGTRANERAAHRLHLQEHTTDRQAS